MRTTTLITFPLILLLAVLSVSAQTTEVANWEDAPDRHWPGPNLWANRLQDWSVHDGALRCRLAPQIWSWRTAHLLSHDLNERGDRFQIELDLDRSAVGRAGLLIAAGEGHLNYRQASMVQLEPGTGGGFLVTWGFADGELSIRDFAETLEVTLPQPLPGHQVNRALQGPAPETATLSVAGERTDADTLRLTARLSDGGRVLAESVADAPADRLVGNIALASLDPPTPTGHVFRNLRVGGDRISAHDDRGFGPIAGVLYSVANGDLKVGVQCVSLGKTITPKDKDHPGSRLAVRLEIKGDDGRWTPVSPAVGVAEPDYYALLRIKGYDNTKPRDFRAVLNGTDDTDASYAFHVPAEPDGPLVIGGVSCTGVAGRRFLTNRDKLGEGERFVGRWTPANVWMPFEGVTEPLIELEPDIVFFTGDQFYEYNPTARDPGDAFPVDDYLYKWLIWHWSFQDVTRRYPSILQTDDHDVWHPNLWGDGGRLMTDGWDYGGGYLQSAHWVNIVHRTMCAHNPDAYDPGPLDSGVTNYFTTFTYGGVDFAVLEDRKFKSAANDNTRQTESLELLGDSQLRMLEEWAQNRTSDVRIVVSQTNYANITTNPDGTLGQDRDTDGWPKPARDRAVALFEKNGAILFTGDQHLASVSRLETADGPGVVQFCQPAAGCIWWRWFYPNADQHRGTPGDPSYLGRFVDGFGNPFEVLAVANPAPVSRVPDYPNPPAHIVTDAEAAQGIGITRRVHQAEGFAIIRADSAAGRVTLECWPLWADVADADRGQFFGWPIELEIADLK